MKKGRFLWSAHRITEKQKVRKARNIKEKQLKNSRNTVSKQLVVHRSSASVNKEIGVTIQSALWRFRNVCYTSEFRFRGVFLYKM